MAKKSKKNKDSIKDGYSGITIPTEDTEVTVSVDVTPSTEEDCEKDQEEGTKVEETVEVDVSVEADVTTPTPKDCEKEEEEGTTQVEVTVEADVTTPTPKDCEKEEEEGTQVEGNTEVDVSVEVDVTPTPEDCEKEEEEGTNQVEVTVEADVTTPTPKDCEKEEEEGTQVEVSVEVDVTPSVEEGEECEEEAENTEVDVSVDIPVTPNNNECVEIPSSEWDSQAIKDAINFGTEWSVQKAIKKGNFASSCDYEIKEINSVCKRENGDNTYYTFSNLAKVDDGKKCYALTSQVTVKTCDEEEGVTKWKYNVSAWRD